MIQIVKNVVRTLLLGAVVCSHHVVAQDNWIGKFAEQVKHESKRSKIPGYAFAVVGPDDQTTIITEGLTQKNGEKINPHTLFRLASVSKTFTSVLASKLVQQGVLDWNVPLNKLLPQYPFEPKLAKEMTLEHILSQSSGYMPNAYDNLIEANYSVDRVLKQLAKLEPICSPGDCYTYQNAIFAAVDKGIDLKLNKNYSDLVKEQIFLPLGMVRASVGYQPLVQDENWAKPHVLLAKAKWRQTRVKPDYYRFAPASGVNASIDDMTKWMKLMLGQYPHILTNHAVEELIKPRTKTTKELYRRHWRGHLQSAHYGLGWRIYQFDGERLAHHSGWVSGYRADVAFSPDYGVGFVFLMNAESNLMNEISVNFWSQFFDLTKSSKQLAKVTVEK